MIIFILVLCFAGKSSADPANAEEGEICYSVRLQILIMRRRHDAGDKLALLRPLLKLPKEVMVIAVADGGDEVVPL